DVVADDHVAAEVGLRLGVVRVGVQRVVVHRDHAEQVVVVLGDGLAGPVLVHVADGEVLEVATEGALVGRHRAATLPAAPAAGAFDWRLRLAPPTGGSAGGAAVGRL